MAFKKNITNDSLVPCEEEAVRAWLKEQGFQEGDLRSSNHEWPYLFPLAEGCWKGELNVCKWLHDYSSANTDITKSDNDGTTPMCIACAMGHLSVCKWLFEVGAAADITKANNGSFTPMGIACQEGHLSVCKWLFEVGAAAHITKASNGGFTPMFIACQMGRLSV